MVFNLLHFRGILILVILLLSVSLILGIGIISSFEKKSPFECGFDSRGSGRLPFSLRFFMLAILFLVFDVEVALLIPLVLGLCYNQLFFSVLGAIIFLIILLIGTLHEWRLGSLSWVLLKY